MGEDVRGRWPKGRDDDDVVYYFLEANKNAGEWEHGERCKD